MFPHFNLKRRILQASTGLDSFYRSWNLSFLGGNHQLFSSCQPENSWDCGAQHEAINFTFARLDPPPGRCCGWLCGSQPVCAARQDPARTQNTQNLTGHLSLLQWSYCLWSVHSLRLFYGSKCRLGDPLWKREPESVSEQEQTVLCS